MKRILLIALGFLVLITAGCDIPDGDFVTEFSVVREKHQDEKLKDFKSAKYVIYRYDHSGSYMGKIVLVLPQDFASVGDHVYSNGTNVYAGPMEAEKK